MHSDKLDNVNHFVEYLVFPKLKKKTSKKCVIRKALKIKSFSCL